MSRKLPPAQGVGLGGSWSQSQQPKPILSALVKPHIRGLASCKGGSVRALMPDVGDILLVGGRDGVEQDGDPLTYGTTSLKEFLVLRRPTISLVASHCSWPLWFADIE